MPKTNAETFTFEEAQTPPPTPKRLTAEEFLDAPDISAQSLVEETKAKAEKGDASAQAFLGYNYLSGQGVPQDYAEAVKWFRKAADQGLAIAQFNLGTCYANGQGVTTNYAEAVKWFRKAAKPEGNVFNQFDPGVAESIYNLGVCYENGYGVPPNMVEAAKWYRKAADEGYAVAQLAIANCYYFGAGVTIDKSEAVKWFRKVAERGDAEAQYSLGACYANGDGVPKDIAVAYKWMNLAAIQGYEPATKYLSTDFEIVTTPAPTATDQRPQPSQQGLRLPPVENQSQEGVALQLKLAELNRRFEQFRQQQALEDIQWQLQQLQFEQEDEAMQQRFRQENEASQRRLDSIRSSLDVVTPRLGTTANSYDPNSLANPYGAGSPYKPNGLLNPYSQYGSPYSSSRGEILMPPTRQNFTTAREIMQES